MIIKEYALSLGEKDDVLREWRNFAHRHPGQAERLSRDLEHFVQMDTAASDRIDGKDGTEIFIVPSHAALWEFDTAVLVWVDHTKRRIRPLGIIEGDDRVGQQEKWETIKNLVKQAFDELRDDKEHGK